jgi:hypothetical protein
VLFEAMRPIVLNGIEEVASRSDLLDRTLSLCLPTIPEIKRRDEQTVWREFEKHRGFILGGLCTAVSGALKTVESINLKRLPRMADFAIWSTAAEPALGLVPGEFMRAYSRNRQQMDDLALESSPVATFVITREDCGSWTGTPTALLHKLEDLADLQTIKQPNWPKTPKALGSSLKRLATNLRARGIDVDRGRNGDKNGTRRITLRKLPPCSSDLSACQEKRTNDSDSSSVPENPKYESQYASFVGSVVEDSDESDVSDEELGVGLEY